MSDPELSQTVPFSGQRSLAAISLRMKPPEGMMSVDEAAGELGVSRSTVERQCQDGRLRALHERGRWWIPHTSLPPRAAPVPSASEEAAATAAGTVAEIVTNMIADEVRRHGAVLPVESVARVLGSPVGAVRRAMQSGSLPACRIGNQWGAPAGQLAAWLDGRWAA